MQRETAHHNDTTCTRIHAQIGGSKHETRNRAMEDLYHVILEICACIYITEDNGDENRKD